MEIKKDFGEGMESGIRLSEELLKEIPRAINKLHEILKNITGDTRELKKPLKKLPKSKNSNRKIVWHSIKASQVQNDLEEEKNNIITNFSRYFKKIWK